MGEDIKQDIRVIIRNGVIEGVLLNTENENPGIQFIDINDDYPDAEYLKNYAEELYADPHFIETDFTMTHGDEDDDYEREDQYDPDDRDFDSDNFDEN